jgi:hypothetical protein
LNEKGNYTKKARSNPNAFKIIYFWKFGKKIMKKGNPNLGITMLFRLRESMDAIILTQENRGYPHPRNPVDLAQGIV